MEDLNMFFYYRVAESRYQDEHGLRARSRKRQEREVIRYLLLDQFIRSMAGVLEPPLLDQLVPDRLRKLLRGHDGHDSGGFPGAGRPVIQVGLRLQPGDL